MEINDLYWIIKHLKELRDIIDSLQDRVKKLEDKVNADSN